MKATIKGYYKPTPVKMRKLGDALLAVAIAAETTQAIKGHSILMTVIALLGLAGKFLTNFFSDDAGSK
jgi:hypothetical protein